MLKLGQAEPALCAKGCGVKCRRRGLDCRMRGFTLHEVVPPRRPFCRTARMRSPPAVGLLGYDAVWRRAPSLPRLEVQTDTASLCVEDAGNIERGRDLAGNQRIPLAHERVRDAERRCRRRSQARVMAARRLDHRFKPLVGGVGKRAHRDAHDRQRNLKKVLRGQ